MNKYHQAFVLGLAVTCTSCGLMGKLGTAACPALRPGVAALDAQFSANAQINGKVRAFVQATKDIGSVSAQLEAEVTNACHRIGADLGLAPGQMQPRKGAGGAAAGACDAVAMRIDAILRQGVSLQVTVQPPQCQANASAQARCAGACDVNNDAECRASCQAHANVHASCQPAQVSVRAGHGAERAGQLITTLQANLPALVHAQIALGQRIVNDAKVVAQIGSNLPRIVGKAGAQALACIGAAADVAAQATVRINVSVRASANVSGRVTGG